ncbi:MAG TPA: SRPBCC domain-containing protein [Candidatus Acidoferrum sp.]|nr:SRPBCC domain-containing protein [Candidatus Acidoferrum sp.]
MQAIKHADREIVITRAFGAPRERVFEALTTPEQIRAWLHSPSAKMDLLTCEVTPQAGGTYRYVFRRANGATIEVHGTYEEVVPPHRLVANESYNFSPLHVRTATVLEPQSNGTAMTITLRYASQEERDADFEGVAASAGEAYARLDRYCANWRNT